MSTIDQMLQNAEAESWDDLNDADEYVFDDERASAFERFQSYVDYCFDTYPIVSDHLDRDQIECYIADWGRRRGQCRHYVTYTRREFGKRVPSSAEQEDRNVHSIFLAEALVGIPPERDKGVGWKSCVRHELGHAIDHERRGVSAHDAAFKSVMAQFGEESNDGKSSHGYVPRYFR